MHWNILIFILGAVSFAYALPYANWENKEKNKSGSIAIWLVAILSLTLSVLQIFF